MQRKKNHRRRQPVWLASARVPGILIINSLLILQTIVPSNPNPLQRRAQRPFPYAFALLAVAIGLEARWLLDPIFGDELPYPTFFAAVILSSWYGGLKPGLFASVLGGVAAIYFFVAPRDTLLVASHLSVVGVCTYFLVGASAALLSESLLRAERRAEKSAADAKRRQHQLERETEERRQVERALRESEERYRMISELTSDYTFSYRVGADNVDDLEWITGAFTRITGYTPEELRQPDILKRLIHPEDVETVRAFRAPLLANKHNAMEFRLITKNGPLIHLRVYARPVWDPDERRVIRFVGAAQDVTTERENRRSLIQAQEQLARHASELELRVAERTHELQEALQFTENFCYSIAHDLRAPLRAMQGLAEALAEDFSGALGETGNNYTERIVAAAVRMDRMIQDLLIYARFSHEKFPLRAVALGDAIEGALTECAAQVRTSRASIRSEGPFPSVLANENALKQVLVHLLDNAIKFVAPGTVPRISLWGDARGKMVRLWVKDNGIGISREQHERIFGIFERLHDREIYPGTGIGLAIVRIAIEKMDGHSGLESEPGTGSTFWIDLPKA